MYLLVVWIGVLVLVYYVHQHSYIVNKYSSNHSLKMTHASQNMSL